MPAYTKTTVYLGEADYRRLKVLARREGRSAAAVLREAVTAYGGRRGSLHARSVGSGRSGRRDLSERAEELLARFGRRK